MNLETVGGKAWKKEEKVRKGRGKSKKRMKGETLREELNCGRRERANGNEG